MRYRLESRPAAVVLVFVLIAIYILVAKVGVLLVSRGVDVTVVWLPAGVALAALFLFGLRLWPGILIGSFIVYSSGILGSSGSATNPETVQIQVVLSVIDTIEALLAAWLLRRLMGARNPCNRPQDVLKFALIAGGMSCGLGATASVMTLGASGGLASAMFGTNWLYQWLAHTIGILVMTPVIINWYAGGEMRWARRRALETAVALTLVLIVGNCVFGGWFTSETSEIPLSCLAVLLLLWPALRLSQRETSTAIFLLAAIAIWGSTKGYGPFADEPGRESILMLQGFVGLVAVSGLGVAADVAFRRQMRNGLHRYKMASLQTADHWIITDKNGVIRELNPSFEKVTGYSESELIGRTPRVLRSGKHDEAYYKNMWETILAGKPYTGVVVNRKKNGELFYEMKTITPIRDEDGVVVSFLSIGKDITDLKLAEQRLEKNAQELERINARLLASEQALLQHTNILESVFNGMDEGVIVADRNGRFVMFNEAAEEILGIGPVASGPSGWVAQYGVFMPDMETPYPTDELPLVKALRGEKSGEAEMYIRNPKVDRGRWITVSGKPLYDEDDSVTGGVAVFRDITQRKLVERVEAELRATREEFEIARQIQTKLFPGTAPSIDGIEIGGASSPAVATGGDYFDYIAMPDGCVGIVVGDVSGHGFGPALLMASVRGFLQALAQAEVDAREMLDITNRLVENDTDDENFVTMIFARLDPKSCSFQYVSAGHTTCYVLDRDNGVKYELVSTGPPLGVIPDIEFDNSRTLKLDDGDVVLMLTDGIIEADCEGCDPFGSERALDVIRANRDKKAADIVKVLHKTVAEYCGLECQDDITSIVIKVGC